MLNFGPLARKIWDFSLKMEGGVMNIFRGGVRIFSSAGGGLNIFEFSLRFFPGGRRGRVDFSKKLCCGRDFSPREESGASPQWGIVCRPPPHPRWLENLTTCCRQGGGGGWHAFYHYLGRIIPQTGGCMFGKKFVPRPFPEIKSN